MDFWSRQLTGAEVYEFYRTCEPYQGNLFAWTDMKFNVHGNIKISRSEFCSPCEQNLTLSNGLVIYSENQAYFKCNEGFDLQGSSVIYCLRTSKWESSLPTCKCEFSFELFLKIIKNFTFYSNSMWFSKNSRKWKSPVLKNELWRKSQVFL